MEPHGFLQNSTRGWFHLHHVGSPQDKFRVQWIFNYNAKLFFSMVRKIFLCECKAHIPFWFSRHSWLVIQEWVLFTRYEVLWQKDKKRNSHIYTNAFPEFQWINRIPFYTRKYFASPIILGSIEWDVAKKMIPIIKQSIDTYPYQATYKLLWPNSNTFTQWILNTIPDFPYKLSRNAFWK